MSNQTSKLIFSPRKLFLLALFFVCLLLPFSIRSAKNAIGVRVARNLEHLSPSDWYNKYVPSFYGEGGTGPSSISLAGYEAVSVGSCSSGKGETIYVNAANIAGGDLYTNIYIIACPIGADQDVIDIFNQLIENWDFNVNIPDPDERAKIQRDTKRLSDIAVIGELLQDYRNNISPNKRYPALLSGTYEVGKSISYWASWNETLGNQLQATLPYPPTGKGWGPLLDLVNWEGSMPWPDDMDYPTSVAIDWNPDGCRVISVLKGQLVKTWVDDYGCVGSGCSGCLALNDSCIDGSTQNCGSDVGECVSGIQTCSSGSWGACVGAVPPTFEICDGKDNDCDGIIDENTFTTYYQDSDSDGYGNPAVSVEACAPPLGYVLNNTDCNDSDGAINPGEIDICDGKDNDCNGLVDEGGLITYYQDSDSDGYGNPAVSVEACAPPLGYVLNNTDCNDSDGAINPGAAEICDGKDNDCDIFIDEGCDKDGDDYCDCAQTFEYGSDLSGTCINTNSTDSGSVADTCDCDDDDVLINPSASEICGSGADEDCDGINLAAWDKHIIDVGFDGADSVYAANFDGDTDIDVLATEISSDDIVWWENSGGGNFITPGYTISGSFNGARSGYAFDIDDDTDMDVLAAAYFGNEVAWWENDGTGSFNLAKNTIDGSFNWARSVHAADFDGDGNIDVVGAGNVDGLVWWRNSGGGSFIVPPSHVIDAGFGGGVVYAVNIDGDIGDTDIDIIGASLGNNDVIWWENDGSGNFTSHMINGSFNGARSVFPADVDGDGKMDILGAAAGQDDIVWWKNVGGGVFLDPPNVIDGDFDGAWFVRAFDFDNDFDMDVLGTAASELGIFLWENDGSGSFTLKQVIGGADTVNWVDFADVDGDSNMDILSTGESSDGMTWWENVCP